MTTTVTKRITEAAVADATGRVSAGTDSWDFDPWGDSWGTWGSSWREFLSASERGLTGRVSGVITEGTTKRVTL